MLLNEWAEKKSYECVVYNADEKRADLFTIKDTSCPGQHRYELACPAHPDPLHKKARVFKFPTLDLCAYKAVIQSGLTRVLAFCPPNKCIEVCMDAIPACSVQDTVMSKKLDKQIWQSIIDLVQDQCDEHVVSENDTKLKGLVEKITTLCDAAGVRKLYANLHAGHTLKNTESTFKDKMHRLYRTAKLLIALSDTESNNDDHKIAVVIAMLLITNPSHTETKLGGVCSCDIIDHEIHDVRSDFPKF